MNVCTTVLCICMYIMCVDSKDYHLKAKSIIFPMVCSLIYAVWINYLNFLSVDWYFSQHGLFQMQALQHMTTYS